MRQPPQVQQVRQAQRGQAQVVVEAAALTRVRVLLEVQEGLLVAEAEAVAQVGEPLVLAVQVAVAKSACSRGSDQGCFYSCTGGAFMARKALIEIATGKVVNVIELEDGANWQPPAGHYVQEALNASPGDTWDGTKFVPVPISIPPSPPVNWRALWLAADTAAKKLAVLGKRLDLE